MSNESDLVIDTCFPLRTWRPPLRIVTFEIAQGRVAESGRGAQRIFTKWIAIVLATRKDHRWYGRTGPRSGEAIGGGGGSVGTIPVAGVGVDGHVAGSSRHRDLVRLTRLTPNALRYTAG